MSTVALDDYLPKVGVETVDFMELDTQGTELAAFNQQPKHGSSCAQRNDQPTRCQSSRPANIGRNVSQMGEQERDQTRNERIHGKREQGITPQ